MDKRWRRRDVGMSCFVDCFEDALEKGEDFSGDDVGKNHPNRITGGELTPRSKRTRAKAIRKIFEEGDECKALRVCCDIQRDSKTAEKARRLYDKHCKAR